MAMRGSAAGPVGEPAVAGRGISGQVRAGAHWGRWAKGGTRRGRRAKATRGVSCSATRRRAKRGRSGMRSKLTEERAAEAARLVAEGLTLDAVAERLGVHRCTILRWAARDPAF